MADFKACIENSELDPLHNMANVLEKSASTSMERKVYFALLHIHPVELDITFRSDVITTRHKDKLMHIQSTSMEEGRIERRAI